MEEQKKGREDLVDDALARAVEMNKELVCDRMLLIMSNGGEVCYINSGKNYEMVQLLAEMMIRNKNFMRCGIMALELAKDELKGGG